MQRNEALELLSKYVKNKNLINHMLSAEAVMKHYAGKFGGDTEKWAMAGLLHDIDVELTKECPGLHGKKSAEILKNNGISEDIIAAVTNHAKTAPEGDEMSRVLFSADQVTGLIVASALIHPDKKLASINADSVMKRFNEKRFAAGAKRENIMAIEKMGIPLKDFIEGSLEAMKTVSDKLGL